HASQCPDRLYTACRTNRARLCWASRRPRAYDQDLAAEHAVPILLSWRSIGLPRYPDSECSDNDDGRGSLLLLSGNKEGLFRLSLSNGAIGRFDSVFFEWPSATKWIRLQSRCDSAARAQRKLIGALI